MPTKNLKDFCSGSLLEGRAEILQIFGCISGETMTSSIRNSIKICCEIGGMWYRPRNYSHGLLVSSSGSCNRSENLGEGEGGDG